MGHSQLRTCSGRETLKRCKNKGEADNVVLIDVDSDSYNSVIIIDFPEFLPKKLRGSNSSEPRKDKNCPLRTVICIDDEESTDNHHPGITVEGDDNFCSDASSSTRPSPASNHFQSSVDADGDECHFVQENTCPLKISKCKRTYSGNASTTNRFGLSTELESGSSDDEGSDCEYMEDCFGKLREQWEKASLKRKNDVSNGPSGMGDQVSASRFCTDTSQDVGVESKTEEHTEAPVSPSSSKAPYENEDRSPTSTGNANLGSTSCNPKKTPFADTGLKSRHTTQFHHMVADVQARCESVTEDPFCNYAERESHKHFEPSCSSFCNKEERSSQGPPLYPSHGQGNNQANHVENFFQNKEKIPQSTPLYPSHEQGNKQVNRAENFFHDKGKIPRSEPSLSDSDLSGGINFFHSKASLPDEDSSLCKGYRSVETEVDHVRFISRHIDEKFQQTPSSYRSNFPNESEHGTSFKGNEKAVSGESSRTAYPSDETQIDHHVTPNENVGAFTKKTFYCKSPSLGKSEVSTEKCCHQEKGEPFPEEPSVCNICLNESCLKQGKSCFVEAKEVSYESMSNSEQNNEKDNLLHVQDGDAMPVVYSSIIDERERLKETDEYKQAIEEEWASRQRELKIQAEEAQHLRRLRKRRKAESMRLLDMERRQKQRLEEIRETQKKDEENMNLKELHRAEVRKELSKLEITCHDMATLLRGLGIHVNDALQVRTAYKRALLSFHPDRASGSDIRQQVEAEEKFKLISRMKEKFLATL